LVLTEVQRLCRGTGCRIRCALLRQCHSATDNVDVGSWISSEAPLLWRWDTSTDALRQDVLIARPLVQHRSLPRYVTKDPLETPLRNPSVWHGWSGVGDLSVLGEALARHPRAGRYRRRTLRHGGRTDEFFTRVRGSFPPTAVSTPHAQRWIP
jgi:hypothetical protein